MFLFLRDEVVDQVAVELFYDIGIELLFCCPLPSRFEHASETFRCSNVARIRFERGSRYDVALSLSDRTDDLAIDPVDLRAYILYVLARFGAL